MLQQFPSLRGVVESGFLFLLMLITPQVHGGFFTEYTNESAFQSSTSILTNVGFDSFSGGAFLSGAEYSSLGLSIVHRDSQQLQILDSTLSFTQYHNLNINSAPSGLGSSGNTDNFDFIFTDGMLAAGLWVGNIADIDGSNHPSFYDDSNGTLVQFYGASGSLLAEKFLRTDTPGIIQGAASPNNRIFYGISYSDPLSGIDPIKMIRIVEGPGDGDEVVFDNVQFSVATVPEPTSMAIFAIGLGVGGVMRKYRQRKNGRSS